MVIKRLLEVFIKIIFIILILGIGLLNIYYLKIDNSTFFFYAFILVLLTILIMYLYKRLFISKKIFYILMFIYFLFGVFIRIYFINNLTFNLSSDFEFVYNNANLIINNSLISSANDYLSFNGYSYIFSFLLSILFRIFGSSVSVVLYTNLVLQVLSIYFLYKIISIKYHKETACLLSLSFFLLPTMIFANLLVATETPFLLLFLITIYLLYKILDKKEFKLTNYLLFLFLGIIICFTNYIRPVMTVFIIALIIYYIIKMKKIREIIFIVIVLIGYKVTDITLNSFVEKGIGMETRSGALGWSMYFGTNYDYCGSWSPDDGAFVLNYLYNDTTKGDKDLIELSFKRLNNYGIVKSSKLFMCKYRNLWINNVGTYGFVNDIVNHENAKIDFSMYYDPFYSISQIFIICICFGCIFCSIITMKDKQKDRLFLELFAVGYILSNLLVCLNGRYNIPLYPILLICCALLIDNLLIPKEWSINIKKITKIDNKKPRVCLIVPAYNEEDSISKTINEIKKNGFDYIIINDGSLDNTELICKKNNYNYISLPSNLGIGGAVQTGYKYALNNNYDIAIQFDADGQHDIKYINKLIEPIVNGNAHFVIGSRFIDESSSDFKSTKMRRIGISLISDIIKVFSHEKIYDTTSGFRAANIDVIKNFCQSYPNEYPEPISSFELLKAGYIIKEVPVKMHERQGGKSSIVSWKKAYYMINVFLSIIVVQIRSSNNE